MPSIGDFALLGGRVLGVADRVILVADRLPPVVSIDVGVIAGLQFLADDPKLVEVESDASVGISPRL